MIACVHDTLSVQRQLIMEQVFHEKFFGPHPFHCYVFRSRTPPSQDWLATWLAQSQLSLSVVTQTIFYFTNLVSGIIKRESNQIRLVCSALLHLPCKKVQCSAKNRDLEIWLGLGGLYYCHGLVPSM